MIGVEEKGAIRKAFFRERKSIRAIAKERGHSRKMIRRALEDSGEPRYLLARCRPSPVMGPVEGVIRGWLEADREAPRKQRHTARRAYVRLVKESGFQGCEASVRRVVALLRRETRRVEIVAGACLPLGYDPGEDAQADWAEALIEIGGVPVVAHIFGMRACYSGYSFTTAFPREDWPSVAEGHARAFEFFGGVFARVWYDNPKTLVGKILAGRDRRVQPQFRALAAHYVFEPVFCNPAEAHEKGGIEGGLGYARRNFMTPVPKFGEWEEFRAYLAKCSREDAGRRRAGTPEAIDAMWAREREKLLTLPLRRFEGATVLPVSVDRYSRVRVQGARYSVPGRFVGSNLLAKVYHDRVAVVSGDAVVAEWARAERGEERLDPRHYLALLERKPRAVHHCRALRSWQLPAVFEELHVRLRHRFGAAAGDRTYVRVLRLLEWHKTAAVAEAIARALAAGAIAAEAVAAFVSPAAPMLALTESLTAVAVAVPDLARYDDLTREVPA